MGDQLLEPNPSNPKGFYEDVAINAINNEIISGYFGRTSRRNLRFRGELPSPHEHSAVFWLAAPRKLDDLPVPADILPRLREFTDRAPFCFKDPRFNITLPVWRDVLPEGTRFIVVFREPQRTVDSIVRHCRERLSKKKQVNEAWARAYWQRTYTRLLEWFADDPACMFLDYNALLTGEALPAIEQHTDAVLDPDVIDPGLSRTREVDCRTPIYAFRMRRTLRALANRAATDLRRLGGVHSSREHRMEERV